MIMIHTLAKVFKEETFCKIYFVSCKSPVVGVLFSSLENKFILKNIMSGGFFDKTKLPDSYLNLLCTF